MLRRTGVAAAVVALAIAAFETVPSAQPTAVDEIRIERITAP